MYVSLSRLRVPEHRTPELIVAFRRRAHLVDDADGFVDLWQSDREANEIVIVRRPRLAVHRRQQPPLRTAASEQELRQSALALAPAAHHQPLAASMLVFDPGATAATFGIRARRAAWRPPLRDLARRLPRAAQIYAHYQPSDQEADAVDRASREADFPQDTLLVGLPETFDRKRGSVGE
jgi:hypothetical protein